MNSPFSIDFAATDGQLPLAEALVVQSAPVGQESPNGGLSFASEELRAVAAEKAFNKVLSAYPGDDEGFLAEYYLAGIDADNGKLDLARRKYQDVADHASANYASIAKLSLAQLDFAQGKINEARAVLRARVPHLSDDRYLASDIAAAAELVRSGALTAATGAALGEL